MATSLKNLSTHTSTNIQDVSTKKFAIVVSEWNEEVTQALYS
ncbi:MAG: 6,7-dimethyl-8-ribityllumazine synthase, partial [Cyclobacteriaceae bacterium]|nr:6,7-dimethyl-8-ribityllumazine synthase [Cyclobacteriaceae bacterium]